MHWHHEPKVKRENDAAQHAYLNLSTGPVSAHFKVYTGKPRPEVHNTPHMPHSEMHTLQKGHMLIAALLVTPPRGLLVGFNFTGDAGSVHYPNGV